MAKKRGIPHVEVVPEFTRFKGGLDLESPAITLSPGALIAGMNYMAGTDGGYSRIDGYERFSGQPSPSAGVYYYCPCTFTDGGPDVGDTVTGADSSETGEVITVGTDYINVTKISGVFNDDEVFTVGGNPKGTFTYTPAQGGETTALLHATALNATADVYRDDISAPAGNGPILGFGLLKGVLYCFRNNAGDTACLIYKQTTAGWVEVETHNEISFGSGTGLISDGDTVEGATSGATAEVLRVVLESGAWGSDAAGRLIIGDVTGGPFQNPENLTVSGVEAATTSLATAITIAPDGRYDTVAYNFYGSTDTKRIYGCDGVNRGFEFDGTVYVPIDTGMTVDKPDHVSTYKKQLFFSFNGSQQNSGVGLPYEWTPIVGAAEIGIGDDIVGFAPNPKSQIVFSRNSTHQLSGSDLDDFILDIVSDETGAIPWTIQEVGKTFALDDRGIVNTAAVQEYGNFAMATVSRRIQDIINLMRQVVVASSVYKSRDQYRLYGNDGTGICMTIGAGRNGPVYYFTQFKYPDNVACAISGEDSTGKDVVFFGSDAGMVYQADKGSSFDGESIEAYIWPAFNNSKSPTTLKTYRKAVIEMVPVGYSSITFYAVLSYGDSDIQASRTVTLQGEAGLWDIANWDSFFWDGAAVDTPDFTVEGDGSNISIAMYSDTDLDLGHKIDGVTIHFTPRRLIR